MWTTWKRLTQRLILLALVGGACGSACDIGPIDPTSGGVSEVGGSTGMAGGTIGDSSGVPRSLPLGQLSAGQLSILCEWTNQKQGGYGRAVSCGFLGRPESTDASNGDCVSAASALGTTCPSLTVADEEDCVDATGTDLCAVQSSPACASINACRQ